MPRCSTSIRLQMVWYRKLGIREMVLVEDMYHRWYISSFCVGDLCWDVFTKCMTKCRISLYTDKKIAIQKMCIDSCLKERRK